MPRRDLICRSLFVFMAVVAASILVPAIAAQETESRTETQQLLEQAASNNLRQANARPFQLKAGLSVWVSGNKPLKGTYEVYWLGVGNWSEVIQMPSYSRVRVWSGDKMWQLRSIPYEPLRFGQLETMILGLERDLRLNQCDTVTHISQHNEHGIRQTCVSIRSPYGIERQICVDSLDGKLLSEFFPGQEELREFSDYQQFGEKRYPTVTRLMLHRKPAVELDVDEVSSLPEGFRLKPPGGAEVWPSCASESFRGPRRIDKTVIDYPPLARREIQSGVVVFYGVIEEDGTPSHLQLVESAFPMLNDAAMVAAGKFRYEPATCNGVPVRVEEYVVVNFRLPR